MEKEGFKRRKCPTLLGKAAGANGHIRKFDAGLVIAGHRLAHLFIFKTKIVHCINIKSLKINCNKSQL